METTQTSTIASKDSRSAWRKTDTMWMLGLYGTARQSARACCSCQSTPVLAV